MIAKNISITLVLVLVRGLTPVLSDPSSHPLAKLKLEPQKNKKSN